MNKVTGEWRGRREIKGEVKGGGGGKTRQRWREGEEERGM